MRKTVLFDLDGTLLPMDMSVFLRAYFQGAADYLQADPAVFQKNIWEATHKVIRDLDPNRTNRDVFSTVLSQQFHMEWAELEEKFEAYYAERFPELGKLFPPNPICRAVVQVLKAKGYDLVLATNPIFPRMATQMRIAWADLEEKDFLFITTYENSHFAKPTLEYYREVLEWAGRGGEECYLVGNDVSDDIAPALELGMETFFLETYGLGTPPEGVLRGNYEALQRWAEGLPAVVG